MLAQDPTNRLDPRREAPMLVDECDQNLAGLAAKKAQAAFKIAFARFSSVFSFLQPLQLR